MGCLAGRLRHHSHRHAVADGHPAGGCSTYNLSFWLRIDTAETTTATKYDTLKVQLLNSSGTVLATLHTYSNLDHNTGYTKQGFSLSGYAGQKITLKFTGAEDYEMQTSFVIDDTAISVG